jgi:hypothetical protein
LSYFEDFMPLPPVALKFLKEMAKDILIMILREWRKGRGKRAQEKAKQAELKRLHKRYAQLKRLTKRYFIGMILMVLAGAIATIVVVHYEIRAARQPVTVVPSQTSVAETMRIKPMDATEYGDKMNRSPEHPGGNKTSELEGVSQHSPDIIRSWHSETGLIRQWNVEHPLIRTWTNASIRNPDAEVRMSVSDQDIFHKWKEE